MQNRHLPAGRDARHEDAVALGKRGHRGAGLDDRPNGFVTEHRPGSHLGDITFQDVQIGAADGRGVDADNRIAWIDDHGIRLGVPDLFAWAVIDEGFHCRPPSLELVANAARELAVRRLGLGSDPVPARGTDVSPAGTRPNRTDVAPRPSARSSNPRLRRPRRTPRRRTARRCKARWPLGLGEACNSIRSGS